MRNTNTKKVGEYEPKNEHENSKYNVEIYQEELDGILEDTERNLSFH